MSGACVVNGLNHGLSTLAELACGTEVPLVGERAARGCGRSVDKLGCHADAGEHTAIFIAGCDSRVDPDR
jgi:hypothetical protein